MLFIGYFNFTYILIRRANIVSSFVCFSFTSVFDGNFYLTLALDFKNILCAFESAPFLPLEEYGRDLF